MPPEIERKFLLAGAPDWLGQYPSTAIEQGYLAIDDPVEVRLRRAGDRRRLTVKRGHGEVRDEVEVELDRDQFDRLWPLTESRQLRKRRYLVPLDGLEAEVDVFEGPLDGLTTAEIEFGSEAAAEEFEAAAWLGEEVTGDERFANQNLVRSGMPDRASPQGA
jgi:CYTH domain-containing protein